jgi:cholesterol oxidase
MQVDGGGRVPRPIRFVGRAIRNPGDFARSLSVRRWSERTVIGLVMQSVDNSLTVSARRHPLLARLGLRPVGLTSRQGHGTPNPSWIPLGHEAIRRIAAHLTSRTGVRAHAGGTIGDVLNVPMTAHFLGGCVIGQTAADGVVDPYHRLHGYPGLHVVDGSTVSANLGVNPSLTITAQAERAMSLWPNKGDRDPRPEPGSPYRRIPGIAPRRAAVPTSAPVMLPTPTAR